MKTQEIAGMVKALAPVLKDRKRAKDILEKYWADRLALIWAVEDLNKAANERGLAITSREARALFQQLREGYNPQYGIKWIDLWVLVDESGFGRKMTKAEINAFVEQDTVAVERGHS